MNAGTLPISLTLLLFAGLAAGIWLSGARLTYLADALSDRFQLSKSLVGLLFLATATSLPEVATTLSASITGNASLVVNNLFGGVALQTAMLAIADAFAIGAISNFPRRADHAMEAILLICLLALTHLAVLLQEPLALWHVGTGSIAVFATYGLVIRLLRGYASIDNWVPVDPPVGAIGHGPLKTRHLGSLSTQALLWQCALLSAAILLFGVSIVATAEHLAVQSGLGTSFVGATLLAGATSLPELTTTITAVRMGAYTLAFSNIFGSNLIMLMMLLPADLLFTEGPILQGSGLAESVSLLAGILVTGIYLVGLLIRRKPGILRLGVDSWLVLGLYLGSVVLLYRVR